MKASSLLLLTFFLSNLAMGKAGDYSKALGGDEPYGKATSKTGSTTSSPTTSTTTSTSTSPAASSTGSVVGRRDSSVAQSEAEPKPIKPSCTNPEYRFLKLYPNSTVCICMESPQFTKASEREACLEVAGTVQDTVGATVDRALAAQSAERAAARASGNTTNEAGVDKSLEADIQEAKAIIDALNGSDGQGAPTNNAESMLNVLTSILSAQPNF